MAKRRCAYCPGWFLPDPRQGNHQKACEKKACRRKRKQAAYAKFVKDNPTYFQGRYPDLKKWLLQHPGFLRHYRAEHPAYVAKDNHRRRVQKQHQKADIQVTIHRREIERIQTLTGADIQDTIRLKIDGLLSHMASAPGRYTSFDRRDADSVVSSAP